MAGAAAGSFNKMIKLVGGGLEDKVVGVEIFELGDTEAAFELADTVEAMLDIVFCRNAPEVVADNALLTGVAHGLHVQEWSAGELGAKLRGDAVMVRSFWAVENDEILGENLIFVSGGIKFDLAVGGESGKLFGEKIF